MKIKVCGLTRESDVALATELGAWALGFIFYEKSPRAVRTETVREITQGISESIQKVGVFVDAPQEIVKKAVEVAGLTTVQLHGDETPEYCEKLAQKLPKTKLIKAIRPKTAQDLQNISRFFPVTQAILIDTYSPTAHGGTGKVSDWTLAVQAKAFGPVILAGGLNAENVQAAIEAVAPDAIDVSSGLEDLPGIKSEAKMRTFFSNARSASMRLK
jgi:phosphoribosylanthranilate isomerase